MKNNFGTWIKTHLHGRSQVWLADQVGVEPPHISRIIAGTPATAEMIDQIADALDEPRILAFIASGHIPPISKDDEWVESMLHKLRKVPRNLRSAAGGAIEAMVDTNEQTKQNPERKTKPASS